MANENPQHFRISDTPAYQESQRNLPPPTYNAYQAKSNVPEYHKSVLFVKWLWVFSSTSLVLLNIAAGVMSIRDMANTNYNSYNHYFMTSAFALTIGVLAVIHSFIIKKD